VHPRRSSHGCLRRTRTAAGHEPPSRSKVDALIVDCDLNGSAQFLHELQQSERQLNTVPLVIMGTPSSQTVEATGALFAFKKPISVEQAVRTLSAARNMILDGRLRYHRAGLEVPVSLNCNRHSPIEAHLINVSQGGLQVHSDSPVEMTKPFQVSFALPGAKNTMKAHAKVAWQDTRGNVGIRFVKVTPRQQRTLQLWLAQQYFQN
jgi:hypothetical protein